MDTVVIDIQDICQSFDGFDAVKNVSFQVKAGEIFGFLGHNGAGKTTLIHMLTTLAQPTSGTAIIAGHDIIADPLGVRASIGYVPENVRLYDTMTTRENLMFFAKLSQCSDPEARVDDVLAFLEIQGLAEKRVGAFSKGMRQRVGLAQAIVHHPRVLFLDEPSSGLDPMGMKLLRNLISRLNREMGMTIFMNTHLISEIAKTCTSIGVLSHGQLVFHDTIEAVTQKYGDDTALEELYLSVTPIQGNGEAA